MREFRKRLGDEYIQDRLPSRDNLQRGDVEQFKSIFGADLMDFFGIVGFDIVGFDEWLAKNDRDYDLHACTYKDMEDVSLSLYIELKYGIEAVKFIKRLLKLRLGSSSTKRQKRYGSSKDFEGSGLIVIGRTQIDNNKIQEAIEGSGFYGVWNTREGYWFFPEEGTLDALEQDLSYLLDSLDINYRIEGQFNE